MVVRTRLHRILQAAALYALAASAIAYFGFHAFHGDHGIHAKQRMLAEIAELRSQLQTLRGEKAAVERRVALLRGEAIDPDMLDQRAREVLNYTHSRDLIMLVPNR